MGGKLRGTTRALSRSDGTQRGGLEHLEPGGGKPRKGGLSGRSQGMSEQEVGEAEAWLLAGRSKEHTEQQSGRPSEGKGHAPWSFLKIWLCSGFKDMGFSGVGGRSEELGAVQTCEV